MSYTQQKVRKQQRKLFLKGNLESWIHIHILVNRKGISSVFKELGNHDCTLSTKKAGQTENQRLFLVLSENWGCLVLWIGLCPSNIHIKALTPMWCIWKWGLWDIIRFRWSREGGVPTMGLASYHEKSVCKPGSGFQSGTIWIHGKPDLGLSKFHNCENWMSVV